MHNLAICKLLIKLCLVKIHNGLTLYYSAQLLYYYCTTALLDSDNC